MERREYFISLLDDLSIRVSYSKDHGRILRFLVQLEAYIDQVFTMANQTETVDVADKIFELTEQFNQYVFEHPEILDEIPDKAVLVFFGCR